MKKGLIIAVTAAAIGATSVGAWYYWTKKQSADGDGEVKLDFETVKASLPEWLRASFGLEPKNDEGKDTDVGTGVEEKEKEKEKEVASESENEGAHNHTQDEDKPQKSKGKEPLEDKERVVITEDVEEDQKKEESDVPAVKLSIGSDPNEIDGLDARIAQIKERMSMVEASGDKIALAELGYILAVSYLGGGKVRDALTQYEQALKMSHEAKHKSMEAACLIDLGSLKLQLGEIDGSIECFEKGLVVGKEFTRPEAEANARFQLGFAFVAAGRSGDAITTFEAVLDQMNTSASAGAGGDDEFVAEKIAVYQALGSELLKAGEPAKAIPHLKEALVRMKAVQSDVPSEAMSGIADVVFFLGSAHFALAQFKEARETLEELLPLMAEDGEGDGAPKTSLISRLLLFARLALSSSFTGDAAAASSFSKRYDEIEALLSDLSSKESEITDTSDEVAIREAGIIITLARAHGESGLGTEAFIRHEMEDKGKQGEGEDEEARMTVLAALVAAFEEK